jgi:transcriptional regulator with XRE-family HTH domain
MRTKEGLTLQEASERLEYKTIGTLANVERGITPLPVEKIHPIAKLYKVDVEEILDKIKECEPELYRKYMTLEKDLFDYLTDQIKNFGRSKVVQRLSALSLIIYNLSTTRSPQVLPDSVR